MCLAYAEQSSAARKRDEGKVQVDIMALTILEALLLIDIHVVDGIGLYPQTISSKELAASVHVNNPMKTLKINWKSDWKSRKFKLASSLDGSVAKRLKTEEVVEPIQCANVHQQCTEFSIAERAFNQMLVLECVASHTADARTTLALALCSRSLLNGVMYVLNSKRFALIMDHYEGAWEWKVGINSSIKRYSRPNIALEQVFEFVPFVRIEDCFVTQPFNIFPSRIPQMEQWTSLAKCKNVQKLYLIALAIDKFNEAWLAGNEFLRLKEVRLESVHEATGLERTFVDERPINWALMNKLKLPSVFFKILFKAGNVQNIQLVSLCLTKGSMFELEKHFNNGKLNKVESCHLEDLIIFDFLVERLDNLIMSFVKRNPENFSLTLCIQCNSYGVTLFKKFIESKLKIGNIHLIINLNQLDEKLFKNITVLQNQCDNMSLTFYYTYKKFSDRIVLNERAVAELEEWKKVTEVNVGKRLYPYLEEQSMSSTETENERDNVIYLSLIENMHKLPNLRKFGLKDRVFHSVTAHLSANMRNWNIDELTLGLSHMHPRGDYEMAKYNELYASIPPSVSSLNLIFCPLNAGSLAALASLDPPLKNLTHFFHQHMNRLAFEVREALPNCSIERRRWLTPISTRTNVITEFICYLNV